MKSNWVQWSRDLLPDMLRLWCDSKKPWRPFSLQGRTGGDTSCPLWGPVGPLRCHLHTMWQTPLVWPFFTPPIPFPSTFLDKYEWRPRSRHDHRQGRRRHGLCQSQLLAPSLHTYIPPHFSSSPSFFLLFSGFRLSLLILWLQDFYQGLAQTYATCHPAVHGHTAWRQIVVWGLNWRTTVTHSKQPFPCLILYVLLCLYLYLSLSLMCVSNYL